MKVLKERFDTLSDAIIAIIMTVLVLEIQIPETVNQLPQLAEAVGLFLVSFVILMNFWFHRLEISYLSFNMFYIRCGMPCFFIALSISSKNANNI